MVHPFIEVLSHISSPLTSSWTVFGLQKVKHATGIRAYLRARMILLQHGRSSPARPPTGSQSQPAVATLSGSKRSFHTIARLPMQQQWCASTKTPMLMSASMRMGGRRAFSSSMSSSSVVSEALAHYLPALPNAGATAISSATNVSVLPEATSTAMVEHAAYDWSWLSQYFPIGQVEHAISMLHDSTGWTWAASIAALTSILRVAVFPLNVSLLRNSRRLAAIDPKVQHLNAVMITSTVEKERVDAANQLIQLYRAAKCHPLKNILSPMFFAPMFLTVFAAVHGMCEPTTTSMMVHAGLTEGGWLWFKDLTAPDTTLVLPSLSAFTWLISIELGLRNVPGWNDKPTVMQSVLRALPALFLPVTFHLPAGVFIYWLTSNMWVIGRSLLLQIRGVRRLFRVPDAQPASHEDMKSVESGASSNATFPNTSSSQM